MLTFFGYSQNVPAVRFQPSIHGPETCGVGVHIFRWLEWILPLAWVHSTNKNLFGGIPDCKSLPGGAFELRWCLDAWDEQCIDDDGTLFQWVMILGSLVLFSSLRQRTPADSRLHQNWSCNASPWRFLSINHSYFLHEGYLKIYIYDIHYTIWIFSVSLKAQHPGKTCRMLEVLDCTICRNTSELISTVRGGFLLVRDMLLFLLFLVSIL